MNNEGHFHVSFRILMETRIQCHMSQSVRRVEKSVVISLFCRTKLSLAFLKKDLFKPVVQLVT